jgi:hypothetical protein
MSVTPTVEEILTHRNIYTNILSTEPNKSNSPNLSIKELAKMFGFRCRWRKFKKDISEMEINGTPVFLFADNGKCIVLVNPYVIKPLNKSSEDLLEILFS